MTNHDDRSDNGGISRRRTLIASAAVGAVVLAGCRTTTGGASPRLGAAPGLDPSEVILGWPAKPQEAAGQMMSKYGPPDGVTRDRLVWGKRGPWKETVVYREEVPHDFPMPHTDLLEQTVDYRVPPDKFDELAAYDGSVIVGRTNGTMAARCDKEDMNFLALNLAHDIVTGKRTVEDARQFYAKTAKAFMTGQKDPYTQRLLFDPQPGTADRDKKMG